MIGLAFGVGVGLGIGAWRNLAPMPHAARSAGVFVVLLAVWLAWRAGKRTSGPAAAAVAVASAKAQASAAGGSAAVQVVVVQDGARVAALREFGGLDSVEWAGEEVTAEQLLGDDVGLVDDLDPAEVRVAIGAPVADAEPDRRGSARPARAAKRRSE